MEEIKRQTEQAVKDIFPILEFHDKVMKCFQGGIDKIPGASALMENLTSVMQIYIFSILAPYVKPILERTKVSWLPALAVFWRSEWAQFKVFEDENCLDSTHSADSNDHFTSILNLVAERVASATVPFAIPLIVNARGDSNSDPHKITDKKPQVFHHQAPRDENQAGQRPMLEAVKQLWEEKNESQNVIWRKRSGEKVLEIERVTKSRTPILGLADVVIARKASRGEVL